MIAAPATAPRNAIASNFISGAASLSPTVLRLAQGNITEIAINELESIVGADPEFSLRILALANSAYYSQLHDIASLRSALVVLGADTVCKLAASLLSRSLLSTPRSNDSTIWRHSQAVGIAARLIAEAHRRADPQQAFVAGLLHDVGLSAVQMYEGATAADFEAHAEIGAEIAELLGLSPCLVSAIRHHDIPGEGAGIGTLEITVFGANQVAIRSGFNHEAEDTDDDHCLLSAVESLVLQDTDIDALAMGLASRIEAFEAAVGRIEISS